jgi:hypothetical protein
MSEINAVIHYHLAAQFIRNNTEAVMHGMNLVFIMGCLVIKDREQGVLVTAVDNLAPRIRRLPKVIILNGSDSYQFPQGLFKS